MNKQQPQQITALYERLSKDDELQGTSNSIKNQQSQLEEYAKTHGFTNTVHFSDDGYSGTNFQRPGWQELIARVEAGEVSCLIIKDSSRMARNYLQAGLYREMFREKGVRLIAINDNVDTANGEDDFTPFREIMAEWYARDTSKKIKSVLQAKGKSGKHLTNQAIYGYRKDPEDKNHWLIDEEAAAVVRRIFQMTIEGKGPYQIARTLTDEKVTRPSVRVAQLSGKYTPSSAVEPYTWLGKAVQLILDKPEYMGVTANFKTLKESYKSNKHTYRPKEDWMMFEETQTPIIDLETWQTAQRCRKTRRRENSTGEANPLTGLVYCADKPVKMRTSLFEKFILISSSLARTAGAGCTITLAPKPRDTILITPTAARKTANTRRNALCTISKSPPCGRWYWTRLKPSAGSSKRTRRSLPGSCGTSRRPAVRKPSKTVTIKRRGTNYRKQCNGRGGRRKRKADRRLLQNSAEISGIDKAKDGGGRHPQHERLYPKDVLRRLHRPARFIRCEEDGTTAL